MIRVGWSVGVVAVILAGGCAQSPEPYLEVVHAQRAALNEMAEILAKIDDETSLAAAKASLDERLERFEKIAAKASALPAPSDGVRRRVEQDKVLLDSAVRNLKYYVGRVQRLNLKGAPAFFGHFEAKNRSLFGV